MEPHDTRELTMPGSMPMIGQGAAGLATEVVGHGRVPRAFTIRRDGVTVETLDAVDLVVARLTFAPGSASRWQSGPGVTLGTVCRGSVTRYAAEDWNAETYSSGLAFVGGSPNDESMVRNEGSSDAEVIVVQLAPSLLLPRRSI